MYLVLSTFTSGYFSLLATAKASVFFSIVYTFPPNIFNINSINQKQICAI